MSHRITPGKKRGQHRPTNVYQSIRESEEFLPSDVVRLASSFANPEDVLALCDTSRTWRERCRSDEFWRAYLVDKDARDFHGLLQVAAEHGETNLFLLLWDLVPWSRVRRPGWLIESLEIALKEGYQETATAIHNLEPDWGDQDWVETWENRGFIFTRAALERAAAGDNWILFGDIYRRRKLRRSLENEKLDKIVAQILGSSRPWSTISRVYDEANQKPPMIALLHIALEEGNMPLVRELDESYAFYWRDHGLWGIMSRSPEALFFVLDKLELEPNVTDVDMRLLRYLTEGPLAPGLHDIHLRYPPLLASFLQRYPRNTGSRVFYKSVPYLSWDEVVSVLERLDVETARTVIERKRRRSPKTAELIERLEEWLKRKTS